MPRSEKYSQRAALVLAVAGIAAVAGCSSSSSSGTPKPSTSTASLGTPNAATGSPITIGLVGDGATNGVDNSSSTDAAQAVVKYANAYLGGINGHVIKVNQCLTQNTPTGGTSCGVQLAKAKVAVADVPVSSQDTAVFTPINGAKIPYFTYTSASAGPLVTAGSFAATDPIASISATAGIAKEKNIAKVAMLVINVPAATKPISDIAVPAFKSAGVALDFVPVAASTADMTPQIQQAISAGAKMFAITGTDAFDVTALKGLRQLGFTGPIQANVTPTPADVAAVPNGFTGVLQVTTLATDPANPDTKLFDAVMATYAKGVDTGSSAQIGFAGTLALIRALEGHPNATTAATISQTLSTMPKPVPLPLGAGLTFQCGQKVEQLTPAVCSNKVLTAVMTKDGQLTDFQTIG